MKTHTIHWISSANGRIGKGTKVLEKEEAERLVTELNRDYPEIDHEAVLLAPTSVPAEPVSAKAVQADSLDHPPRISGPSVPPADLKDATSRGRRTSQ